ncbi:MAG: hypothetical protein AAFV59_08165 [Pseudomonadota bacterium]
MIPDEFPDWFFTNIHNIEDPSNNRHFPRMALDWLLSFIDAEDWRARRTVQARALYAAARNQPLDTSGKGRLYESGDRISHILFQVEAYCDHPHNYEPWSGSAIIPVFEAIGRRLDSVQDVEGVEARVRRMLTSERSQPDGALFELLVSSAYCLNGFAVRFIPEQKGGPRTADFEAVRDGVAYDVECKRMSTSDFVEKERVLARSLWRSAAETLAQLEQSTVCTATFHQPLKDVPEDYFLAHMDAWLTDPEKALVWSDDFASCVIGTPDLTELKTVLETDILMMGSSRFRELVLGKHYPRSSFIEIAELKPAYIPRFIEDVGIVIGCRYKSLSEYSMERRARDIRRQLTKAFGQLPSDRPSIIHVGFDALEEPEVEAVRAAKIVEAVRTFKAPGVQLQWVFAHHFVPDSPPDAAWIFDETVQSFSFGSASDPPLESAFVMQTRPENESPFGHWTKPFD